MTEKIKEVGSASIRLNVHFLQDSTNNYDDSDVVTAEVEAGIYLPASNLTPEKANEKLTLRLNDNEKMTYGLIRSGVISRLIQSSGQQALISCLKSNGIEKFKILKGTIRILEDGPDKCSTGDAQPISIPRDEGGYRCYQF